MQKEKEFELPKWLQDSDGDPVKLFELFYDNEIINMITTTTKPIFFSKGVSYSKFDTR